MSLYTALWYNKFSEPPAYFPIDTVEAETAELAFSENIHRFAKQVKDAFDLDGVSDEDIQRTLYVLRDGGLVSMYNIEGQA